MSKILIEKSGAITTITINRPEVLNAIDKEASEALADAFKAFAADEEARIAILAGTERAFSTGLDLKALMKGETPNLSEEGNSPMGPLRLRLRKPVIAAIEGYAVAGGMAIATWCDMRIAAKNAVFGMLDRHVGVPIVGGVTVTLPKLIGMSHAMDIVLTGRKVDAEEAYRMGYVNRLVENGTALEQARMLAEELASYPWEAMMMDRLSLIEGMDMHDEMAKLNEFRRGMSAFGTDEMFALASKFEK